VPLQKYIFASKKDSISPAIAKAYLYDQLKYFISQKNKPYLKSLSTSLYQRAEKVISSILHPVHVYPNYA